MRKPLIAGNWKMNTTVDEAVVLVQELLAALNAVDNVDRVLCPPFISIQRISELVKSTTVTIGAQNMYFREKGAFTGEDISPYAEELLQIRDTRTLGTPAFFRRDRQHG